MNTCNQNKQVLRDRFDVGEDIADFTEEHTAHCEDCRAYRAELAVLARELAVFERVPAPDDLTARIGAHVRKYGTDGGLRWRDYLGLAGVAGAMALVAGWYAPPLADVSAWWTNPQSWLAQVNTLFQAPALSNWFNQMQSSMTAAQSNLPAIPQSILWPSLALSCTCAVAFNTYFALRMRTAGD